MGDLAHPAVDAPAKLMRQDVEHFDKYAVKGNTCSDGHTSADSKDVANELRSVRVPPPPPLPRHPRGSDDLGKMVPILRASDLMDPLDRVSVDDRGCFGRTFEPRDTPRKDGEAVLRNARHSPESCWSGGKQEGMFLNTRVREQHQPTGQMNDAETVHVGVCPLGGRGGVGVAGLGRGEEAGSPAMCVTRPEHRGGGETRGNAGVGAFRGEESGARGTSRRCQRSERINSTDSCSNSKDEGPSGYNRKNRSNNMNNGRVPTRRKDSDQAEREEETQAALSPLKPTSRVSIEGSGGVTGHRASCSSGSSMEDSNVERPRGWVGVGENPTNARGIAESRLASILSIITGQGINTDPADSVRRMESIRRGERIRESGGKGGLQRARGSSSGAGVGVQQNQAFEDRRRPDSVPSERYVLQVRAKQSQMTMMVLSPPTLTQLLRVQLVEFSVDSPLYHLEGEMTWLYGAKRSAVVRVYFWTNVSPSYNGLPRRSVRQTWQLSARG